MKRPFEIVASIALAVAASLSSAGCYAFQPQTSPDPQTEWTPPADLDPKQLPAETNEQAEQPAPEQTNLSELDLAQALDIALRRNPETKAAWFAAKSAAANKGVAYGAYYPQLDGSVALINERNDFAGNPFVIERTLKQPAAELTYVLLDFGSRSAAARSANEALNAANFQFNRALQQVTFQVEAKYFQLYAAQAAVQAALDSLNDASQSREAAQRNYDVGLKPKQDLLQAEANFRKVEFDLETARSQVEGARGDLAQVLGVRVSENLTITPPDFKDWHGENGSNVSDRIETALSLRPDLHAVRANARARDADIEYIVSESLPKLVTNGRASYSDINGSSDEEKNYAIGLAIQFPIFSGFENIYRTRQAQAERDRTVQQARSAEIAVASDVWRSFYDLQASERKLQSSTALLSASNESYRATKSGYENGANSLLDLLSSQRQLAEARRTVVQARADLAIAFAQLALSTGKLPEMPKGEGN